MALVKQGYKDAIRGTTTAKVAIDENGNISGEQDRGYKKVSIRFANAENGLDANERLLNIFLGFVGTTTDDGTNEMTVKWTEA